MPDREKVIYALELCTRDAVDDDCICANCPYFVSIEYGCNRDQMEKDAIALLKEQEETINELQNAYGYLQKQFFEVQDKLLKEQEAEPEIEGGGSTWWYVCSECRGAIDESDRYCRHCGARMKGR